MSNSKSSSQQSNNQEERKYDSMILIGPPVLTRFELARILGARALQLSMAAPALIDLSEGEEEPDPLILARMEVDSGVLPITIRRMLPDRRFQDIPIRWLLAGLKARKAES